VNKGPYAALITWFAHNHVAANLLMAILLAGGLYSAFTIKKELQPKVEVDVITVAVPFLGATPEDVEEGVLVKIEEAVQDIEGIKEMISTAVRGWGQVRIEVESEYDVLDLLDQVKNRVDAISTFPDNTERPVYSRAQFQEQVVMITVSGEVDERTMKEFAKQIRNEVVAIPGVTRASLIASRPYEISIEVSEFTLQAYGLTLLDVAQAVRMGSLDLPAGSIRSKAGDILVRTKGQAYTGRDFEDIVVHTNADGTRLLLKDIAFIRDEFIEREQFSELDGEPALTIQVFSVGQQSELAISEIVRKYVAEKSKSMPEGIKVTAWADTSYYLKGRLDMMLKNLFFGAALVFLILALFLRLKLAFWVMVGLPIAFLGTFFIMPMLDITVNMLSLFGFILVLGIVVDDAIVIGESAYTNMRAKGHSPDIVVEGALKVAVPATFGVLTTMAAFIPILLVTGITGQFFAAIGWVVVLCLMFSLVESKLILPAHLAHMKVRHYDKDTHNVFIRFQRFFSEGLHHFVDDFYIPWLKKSLQRRYLTLAIFISALILSVGLLLGGLLRFVFFPDMLADFLQVQVEMNEGTPPEQTHEAMRRIQEGLWEVDRQVSVEQGMESGAVVHHVISFAEDDTNGTLVTELVKEENSVIDGQEVLRRWRQEVGEIPGVKTLGFSGAGHGPGGGPAISLTLMGGNIDQVARAARELERRIHQYEGVFDIRNSHQRGTAEIKLNIKPEAESLGLTLSDLARQVRAGFYGEEVQRVQRGQDEVKVMVRFPRDERDSVGYLDNMRIRTPDGGRVPFHAVAEVELGEAPLRIQRFDRERAIRVSAEVDKERFEPEKITADILNIELPQVLQQFPGVRHRLSGSSLALQEVQHDLTMGALFALFMIYALMAIPLKSYAQPLIIMAVIPFGAIGALLGHWIIGIEVSMMSFFGIIALAGVVVNDSLILVDFVNRERVMGVPLIQAIMDAASKRFRAIILTSLTTFFGLVPIVLEPSLQARIVIPMAVSLAFGILFATVITLFLIPSLYLILDDFRKRLAQAWGHIMPGTAKQAAPHPGLMSSSQESRTEHIKP
jgi:multidrug efflux pump subunit AcrB